MGGILNFPQCNLQGSCDPPRKSWYCLSIIIFGEIVWLVPLPCPKMKEMLLVILSVLAVPALLLEEISVERVPRVLIVWGLKIWIPVQAAARFIRVWKQEGVTVGF